MKVINLKNKQTVLDLCTKHIKRVGTIDYRKIMVLIHVDNHPIYKTLIVYIDNRLYYSPHPTKKLIENMGMVLGQSYEENISKGEHRVRVYKAPYVFKNIMAIPDKGVARGGVNWFFANQMTGYHVEPKSELVTIHFQESMIQTQITQESFERQLDRICSVYYRQIKEIESWSFTENIRSSFIYTETINRYRNQHFINEWTENY
ncbi:competence protein ComK [Carnobacteriaceae bacterium zg-ZUI252]|nr:competence protein ComK [Carnobacteriaceae bacterium zg-ZUI252]MBS4770635.1 competence protein ComK [Carnobacteriaceae bacterium zg-ZUI240]